MVFQLVQSGHEDRDEIRICVSELRPNSLSRTDGWSPEKRQIHTIIDDFHA